MVLDIQIKQHEIAIYNSRNLSMVLDFLGYSAYHSYLQQQKFINGLRLQLMPQIPYNLQQQKFINGLRLAMEDCSGLYLQQQKFINGLRRRKVDEDRRNLQQQKFINGLRPQEGKCNKHIYNSRNLSMVLDIIKTSWRS